jgi:hypothetical protein
MTIGMVCISVAVKLLRQTDEQKTGFLEVYDEVQFYSIADNFVGEQAYAHEDPEMIPALRTFYELLRDSEYFDYLPIYVNPVYIDGYSGPDENTDNYEHGGTVESRTVEFENADGSTSDAVALKACWVEAETISYFDLKAEEGRLFEEGDFYFDPDENISVILGHNYADTYDVGDIICVHFIFSQSPAVVAGFLEKGSNIYNSRSFVNFDNYVIMPLFRNDDHEGRDIYNIRVNNLYLFRTEGTIVTKLTKGDVDTIIRMYLDEAGLGDMPRDAYYLMDYERSELSGFEDGIKTLIILIGLITVSVVVAVTVIETLLLVKRTDMNKRYYAVMFLNGCDRLRMTGVVAAESFVCVSLSLVLSLVLGLILGLTQAEERIAMFSGAAWFFFLPVLIYLFMISDRKVTEYIRKDND